MVSQSQAQPQAIDARDSASLPLRKFSFVTTSSLHTKLLWTHIRQDNLQATLDFVTVSDSQNLHIRKRRLRVSRGAEVLEQLYFEDIAHLARLDEQRSSQGPVPDVDRFTLIIIQRPILAIRYRFLNEQIRRIQLNFLPESGYDIAAQALRDYGLPVRDKNEGMQDTILGLASYPTKPSHKMPAHAALGTDFQAPRPLVHSKSFAIGPQVLSQPSIDYPFSHVENSQIAHPPSRRQTSVLKGVPSFNHQEAGLSRHSLPQIYDSGERPAPTAEEGPMFGPYIVSQPSHIGMRRRESDHSDPLRRRLFLPIVPEAIASRFHFIPEGLSPSAQRPYSRDQDRSVSGSKITDQESQGARLNIDQSSQDPVKKSNKTNKNPAPERKQRAKSRKAPAMTLAIEAIDEADEPPIVASKPKARKGLRASTIIKPTAATADTMASNAPTKAPRKLAVNRKATTASKCAQIESVSDQSQGNNPAPTSASAAEVSLPTMDIAEEWETAVQNFVEKFKNHPAPYPPKSPPPPAKPVSNLEEYALRPVDERRAAVDDMIMELIVDPGFATLCEDVEASWKRIGLGM